MATAAPDNPAAKLAILFKNNSCLDLLFPRPACRLAVLSVTLPLSSDAPSEAPAAATVLPLSAAGAALRLDKLPRNLLARVLAVAPAGAAHDDETVLRLTEIGFVPGETVRVVAYGFPGREPIAVRVGRSTFALRAHEAALVMVEPA